MARLAKKRTTPITKPQVPYEVLVERKIRARYSISQELAILRQRDEKPEEFNEYFSFCEDCKKAAKEEYNK